METINENGMNNIPDHVGDVQVNREISTVEDSNSQATTGAGPVDQNVQDKAESETLPALQSFVESKISYRQHYLFSYRDAINKGLKIAFLIGNREVYASQMDKLYKELNSSKSAKFSNPAIIVSLDKALNNGLKAKDVDGKDITSDTPDSYLYVAILDGQHRLMVCLEHSNIDMDLELIDYDGDLMSYIQILNSMDKNWNNEDRKKSNLATGKSTNRLYTESEKIQHEFGVSPKYAEYILTFKRDATKKKDLIAGKESTPYNEENGCRGHQLYTAIAYKFENNKEIKKIEFIDAIVHAHAQNGDSHNQTFTRDMKCFIIMMGDTTKDTIISLLKDKNYGELKTTLSANFQDFCSLHENDMQSLEQEQEKKIKEWASQKKETTAKNGKIKALKKGTPNEILANRKNVAAQKVSKKTDKVQNI